MLLVSLEMVTESKLSFKIEAIGRIALLKMKGKHFFFAESFLSIRYLKYLHRFHLMPIANARCRHIKATFPISVIFYLLAEIHELLLTNNKCTIRYEFWKNWFFISEKSFFFSFDLVQLRNITFFPFLVSCTTKTQKLRNGKKT